ncbi:MAG TPA: T9SS type A sorting domain-containing protein [Bacteroidetes bacterium]|nr:T9SS type A sorting domain-containing protein [Bacteroidota bacterium]
MVDKNPCLKSRLLAWSRTFCFLFALLFVSFTSLNAQYCTSTSTNLGDSNVETVVFNTINNSPTVACASYTDFTSISTNVSIGNSYPISITAGTCGGNFSKYGKVWIDFNGDQDFGDPGEMVFSFGPSPNTQTFNGTVNVPVTAVTGSHRMRVVVRETFSIAQVDSCTSYAWGETEDYTVIVSPSSSDDMGVTAITSPGSGCNLSTMEQVAIDVTNFGVNSQNSWNVSYSLNGVLQATEPMTGPLASAATSTYTFTQTANLSTAGSYSIQAWATLAGDTIPANDTSSIMVTSVPSVTSYPYIEDFESNNGGWLPMGNSSSWAYGTPAKTVIMGAASGTKAYVTGGLGAGSYNSNEDSYVIGPCFDFSTLQNPWISLSVWWNSEPNFDGAVLQYSTDFGLTWNAVGAFGDPGNWYTFQNLIGSPGGQGDGWCGRNASQNGSMGWLTAAHRLDGLAGLQSVRLRIAFGADGSVQDDGFGFDDIRIAEGPVADLGPDTLLCGGDSLTLNPGSFSTYLYSNGPQTQLDTLTSGGLIWVRVTDSLGFYDFDTITVSYSFPNVNIGPDSTICPGDTVVLDGGSHPMGMFNWSNATTNQMASFTTAGTHYVTVTDSVGCENSDSMVITVAIPPSLNLGVDQTVCAADPVTLNAGTGPLGTTYSWNTGATSQVLVVTSPGTYIASVVTPGGCAAIDTIMVFNHPSPGVNLGPDRVECGPYQLDAGGGGTTYLWSTSATTQSISLSTGGAFAVTVSNQFSCTDVDTVTITMGTVPTVNLGANQILCNGQTISLDAGNPGATYNWSNGASSQTITVTAPGIYIAEVTNAAGCTGRDTINIAGSTLSVNLGGPQNICGNQTVVLNAGNPGQTFLWSNGATSQAITVTSAGTYTVTVTDPLGCQATASSTVGQVAGINAAIMNPATANIFQTVQFTDASSPTPSIWEWDFGDGNSSTAQNPSHSYVAFGTYNVRLIVDDGSCRDTTFSTIVVETYIGIEDGLFASAFDLYPNPSNGLYHLYLELVKRQDLRIEVLDLSGRLLFQKLEKSTSIFRGDIDIRNLSQGIYILKLSTQDGEMFRKLIVQ